MLKRIAILFAITGGGHIFSIMVLKFMASHGQIAQVASIGEVESLFQLMIGLIGLGMQTDAIRNISLNENWKEKLQQAQTARITLSILLMVPSALYFSNSVYLCFLMAPLFGSSSDYALYARGFPVTGSLVAFARVVVPLSMGIFSVYYLPLHILEVYIFSTAAIYLVTNIFISLYLKAELFYVPSIRSLFLYVKTFPIGIINLCFYFFGLGILLLAQFYFNEQELVISFLALKFYLVYKGAIRVIHQAFVNQMTDARICLSIDQISIMIGLAVLGSVAIFPDTFISLFFGGQFKGNRLFFILLALSAAAFSIFSSSTTRVLLKNRDFELMKIAISAVVVSVIVLVTLVQFSKSVNSITQSLLSGEVFFSFALAISFFNKQEMWDRISFLLLCSLGLSIPLAAKLIFSESMPAYFISFALMGLTLLAFSYKKLTLPVKIGD